MNRRDRMKLSEILAEDVIYDGDGDESPSSRKEWAGLFLEKIDAFLKDSIFFEWHISDVQQQSEDRHNMKISDEMARDVLRAIRHNYDPCIGVNWQTIDIYLKDYLDSFTICGKCNKTIAKEDVEYQTCKNDFDGKFYCLEKC